MSETIYTPGVCNINQAEVNYRKKAFYLGVGIGIPLFAILVILQVSPYLGVLMFLPAWIGAIGYLQAKHKFCVAYASSGVHNSSEAYAETQKIIDKAAHELDQKRAKQLHVQSVAVGVFVAVLSTALLYIISL